jgi:hypothetical protein
MCGEPLRLLPAVSRAVREFDPDLVPQQPTTQQQQFASSISQERIYRPRDLIATAAMPDSASTRSNITSGA